MRRKCLLRVVVHDLVISVHHAVAGGLLGEARAPHVGAGARLAGAGVAIEKAFQPGGDRLRAKGIRVEALARVKSMSEETGVVFVDERPL